MKFENAGLSLRVLFAHQLHEELRDTKSSYLITKLPNKPISCLIILSSVLLYMVIHGYI